MPRLNDCLVTGFVADRPSVKENKEGQIVQAAVDIIVCNGTHSYSESQLTGDILRRDVKDVRFDNIWLSSKDPVFINKISHLKPYDIIQCKGVVRVSQVRKRCVCPDCGEAKKFFATKTAVYPIFLERLRSLTAEHGIKNLDKEMSDSVEKDIFSEAKAYLKNCVEISNNVSIIGAVAKQPGFYNDIENRNVMLSFPMAVKRSYFVPEDDMATKVDFPYVKMYGKDAQKGYDMLSRGNLLLIRGHLASRSIFRKILCDSCEHSFRLQDFITEIVPRSIEFIREDVTKPPVILRGKAYMANYVGSEAEIDLKKIGMNTSEEIVASGVRLDSDVKEVADAVDNMESVDVIGGEDN